MDFLEILIDLWYISIPAIIILICIIIIVLVKRKYTIKKWKVKNIDGTIFYKRMKIYSKSLHTFVYFCSSLQNDIKGYFFRIDYNGKDWLFLETLDLKIDNDETITLKDSEPVRNTTSAGDNVGVQEIVIFSLPSEIVDKIKNCTKIVFQYNTGKPVEIPQKGIDAIKAFISK